MNDLLVWTWVGIFVAYVGFGLYVVADQTGFLSRCSGFVMDRAKMKTVGVIIDNYSKNGEFWYNECGGVLLMSSRTLAVLQREWEYVAGGAGLDKFLGWCLLADHKIDDGVIVMRNSGGEEVQRFKITLQSDFEWTARTSNLLTTKTGRMMSGVLT